VLQLQYFSQRINLFRLFQRLDSALNAAAAKV
jgi:hypothetical protein